MEDFVDDLDTYEPSTPVERAVAHRLGIDLEQVQLILGTFEEEFDRIEDLHTARENARTNGN